MNKTEKRKRITFLTERIVQSFLSTPQNKLLMLLDREEALTLRGYPLYNHFNNSNQPRKANV